MVWMLTLLHKRRQENNFVNPPIRLLDKVLGIIQQQGAHATVIAPWWPAQTWFKTLNSMSICPPIRVFQRAIIPLNPATPEPLRNRRWKLFAWRVCGSLNHFNMGDPLHQHLYWILIVYIFGMEIIFKYTVVQKILLIVFRYTVVQRFYLRYVYLVLIKQSS